MATDEDACSGPPVPDGIHTLAASVSAREAAAVRPRRSDHPPTVLALADLQARLAAYEYAVLAHADQLQVGADTGCTSAGVWAANATRTRKNVTAAQVRLATAVETRWHRVRDAATTMNRTGRELLVAARVRSSVTPAGA